MALFLAKGFSGRLSRSTIILGGGIQHFSTLYTKRQFELMNKHNGGPKLMFANSDNDNVSEEIPNFWRGYTFAYGGSVFELVGRYKQGRRCWGSQYGWLLTLGHDRRMHLYKPSPRRRVCLPSQRTFQPRDSDRVEHVLTSFIKTFALSSDPANPSAVVMAIYGGSRQLAYASPGDRAWKSLALKCTANHDVIFHKGHFYSINCLGGLSIIDTTVTEPKEKCIATFRPSGGGEEFYLADISGDLHLIVKQYHYTRDDYHTTGFDAYKFDSNTAEWIGVDAFNGHALFVGNNSTFAITSEFPGIKPDCVYFSDDFSEVYYRGHCDMGVYDYANKTLLPPFYKDKESLSKFSRPFYFLPCK